MKVVNKAEIKEALKNIGVMEGDTLMVHTALKSVGYDKNTSIHLADARAEYPSKHNSIEHSAIIEDGKRVWKAYETLFVDGEDFNDIGQAFEEEYDVKK